MKTRRLVKDEPLFDVLSLYIGKSVLVKSAGMGGAKGVLSIFTADNGNEGWIIGDFDKPGWMIFSARDIKTATALPLENSLSIKLE